MESLLFSRLNQDVFQMPQLAIRAGDRDVASREANLPMLESESEIARTMADALEHPLHYPPLSQSVFAGDSVVIALQEGLPHPGEILTALLCQLPDDDNEIVVVIGRQTAAELGFSQQQIDQSDAGAPDQPTPVHVMDVNGQPVRFQIHDPSCDASLAYLLADEGGAPIHINRLLVDADVILPIGCPQPGATESRTLYPQFGSAAVEQQFHSKDRSHASRLSEIELASNTLGAFFTIQVVTGPGDAIHQIVCGARDETIALACSLTAPLWQLDWDDPVDVVVATIESRPTAATWDDFVRALLLADQVAKPKGPIVIWSELNKRPVGPIRQAFQASFEPGIVAKLPPELQQVAAIVQEHPIFLRSKLHADTVEELGFGPIDSVDAINRIAEPCTTGLLLRDAHKIQHLPRSDTPL